MDSKDRNLAMRVAQAVRAHCRQYGGNGMDDVTVIQDPEIGPYTVGNTDLGAIVDQVLETLPKGKWQREMPERAGLYWTRTSDGMESTPLQVCYDTREGYFYCPQYPKRDEKGLFGGSMIQGTCFRGWWWSEPIDPIPAFDPSFLEGK